MDIEEARCRQVADVINAVQCVLIHEGACVGRQGAARQGYGSGLGWLGSSCSGVISAAGCI